MFQKTGLALAASLLLSACNSTAEPPAEPIVDGDEPSAAGFELTALTNLQATPYIAGDLGRPHSDSGFSSKGGFDVRNVVLIERETGATVALLPDQKLSVDSAFFFPAAPIELDDFEKYTASHSSIDASEQEPDYYLIRTRRTVDKKRSYGLFAGSMTDLSGEEVMSGVTSFSRFWMLDDRRLATIATVSDREMFTIIDMAERKVVSSEPITLQFANVQPAEPASPER